MAALTAAEQLEARLEGVPSYPIRRANLEVDDGRAVMDRVEATVTERFDDIETLDGVRVGTGDGWFLIRASGTQPLVRVTAEARQPDRADALLSDARGIVETAR